MSENLLVFSGFELFLAGMTVGLFIIQLFYYLVTFTRPLRAAKRAEKTATGRDVKPVSVIVYAWRLLPEELTDDLAARMKEFAQIYGRISK